MKKVEFSSKISLVVIGITFSLYKQTFIIVSSNNDPIISSTLDDQRRYWWPRPKLCISLDCWARSSWSPVNHTKNNNSGLFSKFSLPPFLSLLQSSHEGGLNSHLTTEAHQITGPFCSSTQSHGQTNYWLISYTGAWKNYPQQGCYAQASQCHSNQHPTSEALEANIDYMDASYNVAGRGHAGYFHRKFGPAACPCSTPYQTPLWHKSTIDNKPVENHSEDGLEGEHPTTSSSPM